MNAAVNLGLGVLLMLFPRDLISIWGVPVSISSFYPNILGAVLAGIGVALLLQRLRGSPSVIGLGIEGAITINMCGAGMLLAWLTHGNPDSPSHSFAFLWAVVLVVLGVGAPWILIRSAEGGGRWRAKGRYECVADLIRFRANEDRRRRCRTRKHPRTKPLQGSSDLDGSPTRCDGVDHNWPAGGCAHLEVGCPPARGSSDHLRGQSRG